MLIYDADRYAADAAAQSTALAVMRQYTFQATGYAGGFLALGMDTERELAAAIPPALGARGLRVIGIDVAADEWDVFSRVFSNQFHYRVAVTVNSSHPVAIAFSEFVQALQGLTGQAVVASNLTSGDPSQSLPDSNPLPGLATGLNTTLLVVAVIVIGAAVVLWEAK